MENAINEWFKKSEYGSIHYILQTQSKTNAGHLITITIFYQEKQ